MYVCMGRLFQSSVVLGPSLSIPFPSQQQQPVINSSAISISISMLMLGNEMASSLVGLFLLMFLLLLLLFLLACRPWRFFSSSSSSSRRTSSYSAAKTDDLERPLFSETLVNVSGQSHDLARNLVEESRIQIDGNISSPRAHGLVSKKRIQTDFHVNKAISKESLILDVKSESSEDPRASHTLKRAAISSWSSEDVKHVKREDANNDLGFVHGSGKTQVSKIRDIAFLESSLTLEVIAGPSVGLSCSRLSTNTSTLPLTLGRVPPSDLLLKDSEISGKHAHINWNRNNSKWEMVDLGSLNGTFLNSRAIHHPDSGSRHWSEPVELENGDTITLGTSSKILVQIFQRTEQRLPLAVGMASDPMTNRGKRLPMEDICYCQWPLPGVEQFGLFCIFDGHGGAGAAKAASRMLPQNVADILSNTQKRESVVSLCNASGVLREAFLLTESAIDNQYEGCTATVLLVWIDHNKEVFAQCANVGDSACVISVGGKQVTMTEDHRIISPTEQARFIKMGKPLKDGDARLCGLNLGRMLGDKFLKEQELRFSSEPFVSDVVHILEECKAFALLASDGLWDVVSIKRAVQLVLKAKEGYRAHDENSAEMVAEYVLGEARTLRTKDNTSIIFLDFDTTLRTNICIRS